MPLTYRDPGSAGTQIMVYIGRVRIAHIRKQVLSPLGKSVRWQWEFSFGNAVPAELQHRGHADTFEEAKAAVERNWRSWMQAAGLEEPRRG
jgi:hypothetical protein